MRWPPRSASGRCCLTATASTLPRWSHISQLPAAEPLGQFIARRALRVATRSGMRSAVGSVPPSCRHDQLKLPLSLRSFEPKPPTDSAQDAERGRRCLGQPLHELVMTNLVHVP